MHRSFVHWPLVRLVRRPALVYPAAAMNRKLAAGRAVLVATAAARVRRRYVAALRAHVPVFEVADHAALMDAVVRLRPRVVFLDVALPGFEGIGGLPGLRSLTPAMKVVLLTDKPNTRDAVLALIAGARGYCRRTLDATLILKATAVVQQGHVWIARGVIPHLLRRLAVRSAVEAAVPSEHLPRSFALLPPRQREIALLVGAGHSNKEIAGRLNVTVKTVKTHLSFIYRKLGVPDRLRLALFIRALAGPTPPRPAP
jgi:DNA-binding NarL/FixJ family response regulator